MSDLIQDLRYAIRTLWRSPGFTAVAVLTLALGIGANTAIFSVVNGVLIEPLPYQNPDRLFTLRGGSAVRGQFDVVREEAESFSAVSVFNMDNELSLTGAGEPALLAGAGISPGLFTTLGLQPALGRLFPPEAERPGGTPLVLLSHELWRQGFGADPDVIGSEIRLDGVSRTIVGVMPPGVSFPSPAVRVWTPIELNPANWSEHWGFGGYFTIARLRSGVTPAQARLELESLVPRIRELVPWRMPTDHWRDWRIVAAREVLVAPVRPMLLVLLGAVGLILLIACVNVANLMMARASARSRELAIRAALGAGRFRLARQFLTESTLLAVCGGIAGILVAAWGVDLLSTMLPADMPRVSEIGVDGRVLAFSAAITLATGLAFGLLPALRASGRNVRGALMEGGRGAGPGWERRKLSGALVATEIALAVVLVIGAGLLIKSFWQRLQIQPGFRTEQVVTATVAPPTFRYPGSAALRGFYDELLTRLEAHPAIGEASVTSQLPFGGRNYGNVFVIAGRPHPNESGGDWPFASARPVIGPDYLSTMDVRLLRGRGFLEADRAGARAVALINAQLAREYWPDVDPIGQRIQFPGDDKWRTIVGLVADVKRARLSEESRSAIYLPMSQDPGFQNLQVLRVVMTTTTSKEAAAADALRDVVASMDLDTPVTDIRTMDQRISGAVSTPRFAMLLLAGFAGLALLLGAIGIYGVIAYAVNRRTREIGVRMALGARAGDVLGMVVRQGVVLAAIGVGAGLVAALGLTRFLSSMLYGVSATDPVTFAAVAVLLAAVAVLASWLPARRAARVDPMTTLRDQ